MKILRALPVLVLVVASGCGGEKKVEVHPVAGRVLVGGQPAEGVKVYLLPTSAPMVPEIPANPRGITDKDGRFTLTTFDEGDGAAEGGYQVILFWPNPTEDKEESKEDRLLGWYTAGRSTLTAQIKPGKNDLGEFKLPLKTSPPEASEGVQGRN